MAVYFTKGSHARLIFIGLGFLVVSASNSTGVNCPDKMSHPSHGYSVAKFQLNN